MAVLGLSMIYIAQIFLRTLADYTESPYEDKNLISNGNYFF
jgi:hypothetical protein